jgi:multidrug transporter EmrE-like cation transporter
MTFAMAIAAAIAYSIGGVFMKLSAGFSILIPSLLVYLCFGIGASIQTLLTDQSQLGLSAILVIGIESVLAAGCGMAFFHETYSMPSVMGIGLIVAGVAVLRSTMT